MTDFSFNGTNASDKGLTVINIRKPIIPILKQTVIDIPKFPGVSQSNKKFSGNEIVVESVLVGTSASDLVDKLEALAKYLYYDEAKQLIFDDQSDRYWLAQVISTSITRRTYRFCFMDIPFTCNDPFAYKTTATTDDRTISADDTTYSVTNGGDTIAYPTITLFFNQAQTHVYVENTTIEDNRMDISKAFSTSDELVIDCKNMTVKLNGANSPAGVGNGGEGKAEFMMLDSGANSIQIGTEDESINLDITISFNAPYLF